MANTEITRGDVKKGFSEIPGAWKRLVNLFTWDFVSRRLNAGAIGRSVAKYQSKHERDDAKLQLERTLAASIGEENTKYMKDVYGPTYWDSWANNYDIRIAKMIRTTGWITVGSEYNSPFAMGQRKDYLKDFDKAVENYQAEHTDLFQTQFKEMEKILYTPDADLFERNGIQIKNRVSFSGVMKDQGERFYNQLPFVQQFLYQGERPEWHWEGEGENAHIVGKSDIDKSHRKAVDFEVFKNAGGMQLLAIKTRYMQQLGGNGRAMDWNEEVSLSRWRAQSGTLMAENNLLFGFGDALNGTRPDGLSLGYDLQSMSQIYDVAISGMGKNGQRVDDCTLPPNASEETKRLFKAAQQFSVENDRILQEAFSSSCRNPEQLLKAFYQDSWKSSANLDEKSITGLPTLGTQLQALILSSGESKKSEGYSQIFQARLAARVDQMADDQIKKLVARNGWQNLKPDQLAKKQEVIAIRNRARQIKSNILYSCQQRNAQDAQYCETKTNPLQIANEVAINFCFYGERPVYNATIAKNSFGYKEGKDITHEIMELLGGQHWGLGLNTEYLLELTSCKKDGQAKQAILTTMEKNGWLKEKGPQECQKMATRILEAAQLLAKGEVAFEGYPLNDIMKNAQSLPPDHRAYMIQMLYEITHRKHLKGADTQTADWIKKSPAHEQNLKKTVRAAEKLARSKERKEKKRRR